MLSTSFAEEELTYAVDLKTTPADDLPRSRNRFTGAL